MKKEKFDCIVKLNSEKYTGSDKTMQKITYKGKLQLSELKRSRKNKFFQINLAV